eukprot:1428420-Pyramimonas_sp.AAC.1
MRWSGSNRNLAKRVLKHQLRSHMGFGSSDRDRTWNVRAQIEIGRWAFELNSGSNMGCHSSDRDLTWDVRAHIETSQ